MLDMTIDRWRIVYICECGAETVVRWGTEPGEPKTRWSPGVPAHVVIEHLVAGCCCRTTRELTERAEADALDWIIEAGGINALG